MALAAKRATRIKVLNTVEMASTNEQVYQGGTACLDTSTGRVKKGAASTTLVPIGVYAEDKLVTGNAAVKVSLFKEVRAVWRKNSAGDAVVAANVGSLCYIEDDETVAKTDATNTLSVAGRVWAVDATRGVLVEPRAVDSHVGGLDN